MPFLKTSDGQDFRRACPNIPWLSADSPGFTERRVTFIANDSVTPKAIICPRTTSDVQKVVQYAREVGLPFTVRSGGHDSQGRSVMDGVLCIDMRDLNAVELSKDRMSATIGGGILTAELQRELSKDGYMTPFGNIGDVGYFGWASLGGYSVASGRYGLGVDQILTAEVVNSTGEVVQADKVMLKAIRGAGGSIGIVTKLEVKIYPLRQMLSGMIMLDSTTLGIAKTFEKVMASLQEVLRRAEVGPEMSINPIIMNHPENGTMLILSVCWVSDDHELGRKNVDTLCKAIPTNIIMNTVAAMTINGHLETLNALFEKSYWGGFETVSFNSFSPKTLKIMGKYLDKIPKDPGTAFNVHTLRRESPTIADKVLAEGSCFPNEARQPHYMLELIGLAKEQSAAPESMKWAGDFCEALTAGGEAMKATYVPLSGKRGHSMDRIYGKNWEVVKQLKKDFDPEGVFKYAVPVSVD